jgi:hypothetical protein
MPVFPIRDVQPGIFVRAPLGGHRPFTGTDRIDPRLHGRFVDADGKPVLVSAHDGSRENGGKGRVLTNLWGFDRGVLLKQCPCGHPAAAIVPADLFGRNGRTHDGTARDQARLVRSSPCTCHRQPISSLVASCRRHDRQAQRDEAEVA